ncbi:hypothetical protein PIB30_081879 [Stylosanthes scabra]|uniref:Uncharacterized protein n=1 Tax=Stylosanthes scabra TaxID=79078 RepID=A0ABU6XRM0_9FABA|nr:hypothetical protein [Stylosanthes scabra]
MPPNHQAPWTPPSTPASPTLATAFFPSLSPSSQPHTATPSPSTEPPPFRNPNRRPYLRQRRRRPYPPSLSEPPHEPTEPPSLLTTSSIVLLFRHRPSPRNPPSSSLSLCGRNLEPSFFVSLSLWPKPRTAIFFTVSKFGPCSRDAIDATFVPLSSASTVLPCHRNIVALSAVSLLLLHCSPSLFLHRWRP